MGRMTRSTSKKRVRFPRRGKSATRRVTLSMAAMPVSATPTSYGPLRKRQKVKFTFMHNSQLNPAAGGLVSADIFSTNGLYDPYLSPGGAQPRGFDEMMGIYGKYHVIGSRITVTFSPGSTPTQEGGVFGVSIRPGTTVNTDYRDYIEPGRTRFVHTNLVGSTLPKITMTWSPKRALSVKDVLDEGALGGDSSANPTKQEVFHVWAGPANQSTDYPTITAISVIEYIAVLTDPAQLTGS